MHKTVSLHTLGCKLNYSETSSIAKQFQNRGITLKEFGEKTDIFVLNTCTVTNNADRECKQIIRSVIRNNPDTYVIVAGCYAQLQPGEIASIEGVDLILGTNEKFKLFDYIDNFDVESLSCFGKKNHADVYVSPLEESEFIGEAFSSDVDSRTRAFLKIQDGCDYNCSFCTIPLARGKSRSLAIDNVIDNAKKIIDSGYKEIILTGVNTGDYGYSDENRNYELLDVLFQLDKLDIKRIRISSIEPNLLNDNIIELVKSSDKFCNHFHIPLQSGDSDILKKMRRRYNPEFFGNLIQKLNEKINDAGIGIDVIVGFPGEKEKHFENTFNFINSLNVSYLHVFNYSERRDTQATEMDEKVDVKDRKLRSQVLRNLSNKKKFEFYLKHIDKTQDVLFESAKNGSIEGWTPNYIRVKVKYQKEFENNILPVRLKEANGVKYISGTVDK
ncbi:MAG: tRNA (N(6)-L-threonylcarbamoyladenosine(37)-C(2))-methylthiotransferase MtaB [Ignavibacteriae bacterium]|nr:tRNA (N(6)-L-threonylcarbamoyladenosine(37)-C(2))-methylthiotransferase MtaB [Ignavibacteriota bacterium]